MIRTALAALYLLTIPGPAAWAQAARVAPVSASSISVPLNPSAGAALPGLGAARGLSAPSLSLGLTAAPSALSAPAARAAGASVAPPYAAVPFAAVAPSAPASAGPIALTASAPSAAAHDASAPAAAALEAAASPRAPPAPALAAAADASGEMGSPLAATRAAAPNEEAAPVSPEAASVRGNIFDGVRRAASDGLAVLAAAPRRLLASGLSSRRGETAPDPAHLVPSAPAAPPSGRAPSLWGYLSGTFGAQLASNALQVTMPLLFLKMTGSAAHAAFAVTIGSFFDAGGAWLGGGLTDRFGAKPVLLATTVARLLAVAALPLLAMTGGLTLPAVGAAYVVECFARGLADTARSTLPVELSGGDNGLLKWILAKNQTFFEAGGVAGPFLVGALIAGMGGVTSAAALWLGPVAFAFVTLAYLAIPRTSPAAAPAADASAPAPKVFDGWMKWALLATAMLAVYPLKGLLPAIFASQILHSEASAAWLTGLFGVGGFLGALAYGKWNASVGMKTWMLGGVVGVAALAAAFLPGGFLPAALGVLVFSIANVAARLSLNAAIQSRAAPGKAGAAMGPVRSTANFMGLAIRFLAGLAFTAAVAPAVSFWLVGAGLLGAAGVLLFASRRLLAPKILGLHLAALGVAGGSAGPRVSPVHGMPGRLIVVEGLDGSGKSTQMERLKEELEARGLKVVTTSWNSSETVADAVKKAKKSRTLNAQTFALMNAADLADRMEKTIVPALKEGSIVLADRWFYTSLARDGVRGNEPRWLRRLYDFALKPDLVLYFRLPAPTAINRVMARARGKVGLSEDFEDEPDGKVLGQNYYAVGRDQKFAEDDLENFREFQTRVTAAYDAQAREFGFRQVDASKSRDVVFGAVMKTALGALGPLESFRRRDGTGPGANLFDKDPAADAENIRRNYVREKRGVHFYFRNMLLPMQERFAQLLDLAAMPKVFLHGSPHVDNYAKSHQGAAMVDFDRARVGPYAWDLVRLMVSLSLRQKKPAEGLLDRSVLKQMRKGYLHGFRHPDRPFSEVRQVKDVEADADEETVSAYAAANGKWAKEMRANPLPVDDPDVTALIRGYDESAGGRLLDKYEIEEAGRGQGSMGFRGLFLVVLAPKDKKSKLDRILLNIKQVRSDPDSEWFKNPYPSEVERMHAAAELYAPGWTLGPGSAVLDGVEYDVRQIDPLNAKIKKMFDLEQQEDFAYAVGTQLGRAHRLSLQGAAAPDLLIRHFVDNFDALAAAGLTIRDELAAAHQRYLKRMDKAGLTPGEGGDEE